MGGPQSPGKEKLDKICLDNIASLYAFLQQGDMKQGTEVQSEHSQGARNTFIVTTSPSIHF